MNSFILSSESNLDSRIISKRLLSNGWYEASNRSQPEHPHAKELQKNSCLKIPDLFWFACPACSSFLNIFDGHVLGGVAFYHLRQPAFWVLLYLDFGSETPRSTFFAAHAPLFQVYNPCLSGGNEKKKPRVFLVSFCVCALLEHL